MELSIQSTDGNVVRVQVAGQIVQNALASSEPLGKLLNNGFGRKVLLSLAEATFIDSSGLGWLLGCNKRFRECAGLLVVHSVPPMVLDVMKVMQLDRVLKIAEDDTSALALAQGGNP